MIIPKKIKSNLNSAKSLINDSDSLPGAFKHNASRVFFLITAWELAQLADNELSDFVKTRKLNPKIYRDHKLKLIKAPTISHISRMSGKAKKIQYLGKKLAEVRQWALFGKNSISREVLFMHHWFYDSFTRRIKSKIGFLDISIDAIEKL
jgi:hypothetical protein